MFWLREHDMAINYNAAIPLSMFLQKRAGSISLTTQQTIDQLIASLFADGSAGAYYNLQNSASWLDTQYMLDLSKGLYGNNVSNIGVPVTVGVADAAEYNQSTGIGQVYRADMYNQSIVNFDVNNNLLHELVIENVGSNPIAVNADLAMGTVLFTVAAGQKVTRIVNVGVVVITSANDVSTAYFKVHSLRELIGNHATQANSGKRASLITDPSGYKSLKFDGVDDGYVTPSINFTNTDKVTMIAAVRKLSDVTPGSLLELSTVITNTGTFALQAPSTGGFPTYSARVNGNPSLIGNAVATGYNAPHSAVLTAQANLSAADNKKVSLRVNGSGTVYNSESVNTGMLGNYPLYIGRRGGTSLPFNGQIYALLVIGKLLDDATTQRIEKEFAKYIGVTL